MTKLYHIADSAPTIPSSLMDVRELFATSDSFVVTLDTHPTGAFIFLLLIVVICYAIVAWRKR